MEATMQTYCRESCSKKIEFKEIDFFELEYLVRFGFQEDPELLEKYQQISGDFEKMVQRNMRHILEGNEVMDLSFFMVRHTGSRYSGKAIGFFVADVKAKILFSFGINVNFRKAEILTEWIDEVKQLFGNEFNCGLWSKNERAIKFLQKNGMKINKQDELITYLIYKKWQ